MILPSQRRRVVVLLFFHVDQLLFFFCTLTTVHPHISPMNIMSENRESVNGGVCVVHKIHSSLSITMSCGGFFFAHTTKISDTKDP